MAHERIQEFMKSLKGAKIDPWNPKAAQVESVNGKFVLAR